MFSSSVFCFRRALTATGTASPATNGAEPDVETEAEAEAEAEVEAPEPEREPEAAPEPEPAAANGEPGYVPMSEWIDDFDRSRP